MKAKDKLLDKHIPRKLSVIFYADVEGYTRLTEKNEDATFRVLTSYFDLIASKIELFRGNVLQYAGDAVLAKFDAVVSALACAVEIQEALAKKNSALEADCELRFRIGINVSDVIEDKGGFYGSGVNIAARLESLAEPGGICISESVRTLMGDSLPLIYTDIGEQAVKNIETPIRVFKVFKRQGINLPDLKQHLPKNKKRWQTPVKIALLAGLVFVSLLIWFAPWKSDSGIALIAKITLPSKPSIAVLAFNDMSDDADQEYFADGLVENIITDLSRYKDLFVIARHSSFQFKGKSPDVREVGRVLGVRYVLEGSIQKSDNRVRVTVQLIDAATAGHIWADRYDRPLSDIFKVQDEISDHIVSVIAPVGAGSGKLQRTELDRLARTPTEDLRAFDYFLRGVTYFDKFTKEDNLIAREMFEKAAKIDPGYARAIAKIAKTHLNDYWNGWTDTPEKSLRMVGELSQQSINRDPNSPWGHFGLGTALLFQRKHDAALKEIELAVKLAPGEADIVLHYGFLLTYAGRPHEAFPYLQKAMRLNPIYPGWYLWDVAWAHFFAKQYSEASAALEKRNPKSNFTYLLLAASYTQEKRFEEAAIAMKKFRELEPEYSVKTAATTEPFKKPQDLELWLSTLREAGLPE